MNVLDKTKKKNIKNNQTKRSIPSKQIDGSEIISYYEHHKIRQFELAKQRNKAALNSMFFVSNL